ncbi:MAG: hypothetical protein MUP22_08635 [Desulfobacterales bacterium]|nr:hypothetical protein [Desulfobacterales bacterium]
MKRIVLIIVMFLLPLFMLSCSGTQEELLGKDYTKMSDDELLKYYYQIEDEIAKCENKSSGASVGIGGGRGWGSGGGFGGVGVGVSKGVGGCESDDLRNRRIDVRLALKKRGLNP